MPTKTVFRLRCVFKLVTSRTKRLFLQFGQSKLLATSIWVILCGGRNIIAENHTIPVAFRSTYSVLSEKRFIKKQLFTK